MKIRDRFIRFAVAISIAGMISAQIPSSGVSALAQDGYNTTNDDNSGDFLGIDGVSNRDVIQTSVFGLVGYGVYSTVFRGAGGGGGGAVGGGAAAGGGGSNLPLIAGDSTKSLFDVASGLPDNFSTLSDAARQAGDDTLREDGPFTVFGPTNEAFAKLPEVQLQDLMRAENKAQLKGILDYHVVRGRYTIADLKKMEEGRQLLTVSGKTLTITNVGGLKVNGIPVVEQDIEASNGLLHPIGTVLTPPAP